MPSPIRIPAHPVIAQQPAQVLNRERIVQAELGFYAGDLLRRGVGGEGERLGGSAGRSRHQQVGEDGDAEQRGDGLNQAAQNVLDHCSASFD
jgi:hypothetical protein